ncbi:hypothetical protein [Burkholderia cepacia]|uniref:hypothetical protein n=1 Tax=Burkholderia cepacia TaxID=292 RepID=UPI000F5F1F2C|nr:hypothetical protein [Burkholderia cepacia]
MTRLSNAFQQSHHEFEQRFQREIAMAALDFANVGDRSNGVPGHLPALIRIFMRLLALFPAFMVLIAHAAGPADARVARARSP